MSQSLSDLAAALLEAAQRAGAESADVLVAEGTSISIDVRDGRLEQAERSEGIDLGLRVLLGKRQACVSSSDSRRETLETMAERAMAMAREAPEDPHVGLADPGQLARERDASGLELDDPAPEPEPSALEEAARRAEAAARAVSGVTGLDSAGSGYGRQNLYLAATNGFAGGYARSSSALSCVAIAGSGTGMERDYFADSRVFSEDLMTPEAIGREAGARAVARLGGRKPPTGRFPVVYDERVAGSLIGHLLAAINGSAIARGSSWARDLLGKRVLPAGIDLREDPRRPRIWGSRPFDGEGLPARPRDLVRDGILQGWTLDLATARKLGMESTGNAARGTSAPPTPAAGNVVLSQGAQDRAALLSAMGRGLLVTQMMGASINATTGDYSRGASGFWVENGEITHPVNECTIAGNLHEMLAGLVPADDARPHLGMVVPSLLVEGLTIAGA